MRLFYNLRPNACLQNKEEKASELHELEKDVREEEERVDKIDADMKRLNDATNKLKNKCALLQLNLHLFIYKYPCLSREKSEPFSQVQGRKWRSHVLDSALIEYSRAQSIARRGDPRLVKACIC